MDGWLLEIVTARKEWLFDREELENWRLAMGTSYEVRLMLARLQSWFFFQGESHEIYGSYLEIGSGRNKVWLIGESYLA